MSFNDIFKSSFLENVSEFSILDTVIGLAVALVIDLVKRSDAQGTWHASHFSWRLRSVIWAGILYIVTAPLWLLFIFPGWIAWCVISIWFLYRIVRGMIAMNKQEPLPV